MTSTLDLHVKKVHFDKKRFSLVFIKELYDATCKSTFTNDKKSLSYLIYGYLIATHILNNCCLPKDLKINSLKTSDEVLSKLSNITFSSNFVDFGSMLFDRSIKGIPVNDQHPSPEILDQSTKRERLKNTLNFLSECSLIEFKHVKGQSEFSVKFSMDFLRIYRNSLTSFFIMPENLYCIFVSADCSSAVLALVFLLSEHKTKFNKELINFYQNGSFKITNQNTYAFINSNMNQLSVPSIKILKEFFLQLGISKSNVVGFAKRAISFITEIFCNYIKCIDMSIMNNRNIQLTKKFSLYLEWIFVYFKDAVFANFKDNSLEYLKKAVSSQF